MKRPGITEFKKASQIAELVKVKCMFAYTNGYSEAVCEERTVIIDLCEVTTKQLFWSIFFHEMGHMWCYDHDKYLKYHTDDMPAKQLPKYIRRIGLRAEKYVDTIGKRLMKLQFPRMTYRPAYKSKADIEWYKGWVNKYYPLGE